MDTNVFVAALRSRRGASFELLQRLRKGDWRLVLSNPLLLEYEEIGKKQALELEIPMKSLDDILDALCSAAELHRLTHGWHPRLTDPDDEMVLQLAAESRAEFIITHNQRHLQPAREFGIVVMTPREFLAHLRGKNDDTES